MHEEKVVILLICCFRSFVSAVDMDYFFSGLRDSACYSTEGQKKCKNICSEVPVLCHEGECYCHQSVLYIKKPQYGASLDLKQEVKIKMDSLRDDKKSSEVTPDIMLTNKALRPALRHHIAHFCPSLDVARKCIKKCMKTGKPAFCGKDHTCYCGHKYSHHDSKDEKNALDVYKEFSDMYAKYLGNAGGGIEDSDETLDDNKKSNTSPK